MSRSVSHLVSEWHISMHPFCFWCIIIFFLVNCPNWSEGSLICYCLLWKLFLDLRIFFYNWFLTSRQRKSAREASFLQTISRWGECVLRRLLGKYWESKKISICIMICTWQWRVMSSRTSICPNGKHPQVKFWEGKRKYIVLSVWSQANQE